MPCTDGAHRQFDFWIGDWDVFDVERPTVIVAHARVELILNGCVLHEVYEGVGGHKGESFSIYDGTRDTWHQTWVNDQGYLLTIEGRLHGEAMILQGVDQLPDGKPRQVRGEWRTEQHGLREVAPADERDADRLEVSKAHRVHLHENPPGGGRVGPFGKDAPREAAGERRDLRDRRAADPRQRAG